MTPIPQSSILSRITPIAYTPRGEGVDARKDEARNTVIEEGYGPHEHGLLQDCLVIELWQYLEAQASTRDLAVPTL